MSKKPYKTPQMTVRTLNPASFAGNYSPSNDPLGFSVGGNVSFGDSKN